MKGIPLLLIAAGILAGIVALTAPASLHADDSATPIFVTKIPPRYRDWKLISVAHEEGNLHSIGAVLGNDVAIQAYREGKLPFLDGATVAALHYGQVPSAENNKVFGQAQSFVAGPASRLATWSSRVTHLRLGQAADDSGRSQCPRSAQA